MIEKLIVILSCWLLWDFQKEQKHFLSRLHHSPHIFLTRSGISLCFWRSGPFILFNLSLGEGSRFSGVFSPEWRICCMEVSWGEVLLEQSQLSWVCGVKKGMPNPRAHYPMPLLHPLLREVYFATMNNSIMNILGMSPRVHARAAQRHPMELDFWIIWCVSRQR